MISQKHYSSLLSLFLLALCFSISAFLFFVSSLSTPTFNSTRIPHKQHNPPPASSESQTSLFSTSPPAVSAAVSPPGTPHRPSPFPLQRESAEFSAIPRLAALPTALSACKSRFQRAREALQVLQVSPALLIAFVEWFLCRNREKTRGIGAATPPKRSFFALPRSVAPPNPPRGSPKTRFASPQTRCTASQRRGDALHDVSPPLRRSIARLPSRKTAAIARPADFYACFHSKKRATPDRPAGCNAARCRRRDGRAGRSLRGFGSLRFVI